MTKDLLQKELLEKIKLGTKPSDLKKRTISIPTPPDSPIITPIDKKNSQKPGQEDILPPPIAESKKLNQLQTQVNY